MSFCHAQCLHSPWLSSMNMHILIISGDGPVCTYNAFVFISIYQKILYYILAIAVRDILSGRIDTMGNSVIWHHCGSLPCRTIQIESAFDKDLHGCFKLTSWEHSIFSKAKMCITTRLTCRSSWPMLNHTVHTLCTPSVLNDCISI